MWGVDSEISNPGSVKPQPGPSPTLLLLRASTYPLGFIPELNDWMSGRCYKGPGLQGLTPAKHSPITEYHEPRSPHEAATYSR